MLMDSLQKGKQLKKTSVANKTVILVLAFSMVVFLITGTLLNSRVSSVIDDLVKEELIINSEKASH